MKSLFKIIILITVCSFNKFIYAEKAVIVNWNLQTFFDANLDGTEYKQFQKSEKWGVNAYKTRLERLCSALKKMTADIYVFQEIENEKILYDIKNFSPESAWIFNKKLKYSCFAKNNGSPIGCAVLSRYPISEISSHNLMINTEKKKQPCLRPIIKMKIKIREKEFILLVNHWKSKLGGEAESEIWRIRQESLLAFLVKKSLAEEKMPIIICGDFNKDITAFIKANSLQKENSRFKYKFAQKTEEVFVYSPWILKDNTFIEPGSYYFKKNWLRIDHFFSAGEINITDFSPVINEDWCTSSGKPKSYRINTGSGYSDHFPIRCSVEF